MADKPEVVTEMDSTSSSNFNKACQKHKQLHFVGYNFVDSSNNSSTKVRMTMDRSMCTENRLSLKEVTKPAPGDVPNLRKFVDQNFTFSEMCRVKKLSYPEILQIMDASRSCPSCSCFHGFDYPCNLSSRMVLSRPVPRAASTMDILFTEMPASTANRPASMYIPLDSSTYSPVPARLWAKLHTLPLNLRFLQLF